MAAAGSTICCWRVRGDGAAGWGDGVVLPVPAQLGERCSRCSCVGGQGSLLGGDCMGWRWRGGVALHMWGRMGGGGGGCVTKCETVCLLVWVGAQPEVRKVWVKIGVGCKTWRYTSVSCKAWRHICVVLHGGSRGLAWVRHDTPYAMMQLLAAGYGGVACLVGLFGRQQRRNRALPP